MVYLFYLDKTGSSEQLMLEGSVTMDDSAVISATRIRNNGEDVVPVGFIKKSLTPDKWWDTDNQMITDQWNSIWVWDMTLKRIQF